MKLSKFFFFFIDVSFYLELNVELLTVVACVLLDLDPHLLQHWVLVVDLLAEGVALLHGGVRLVHRDLTGIITS